jgi:hypothetical protein
LLGDTDTDTTDTGAGSDPSHPSDGTAESSSTGPSSPPGPPMLIEGRMVDPLTVELVFSEPIAATGAITPSNFRLSAAFANGYYSYGTFYADLGRWNGTEMCYQYCYGDTYGGEVGGEVGGYGESGQNCNEWCYTPPGPPVHVIGVTNGAYSDRVLLTLDQMISANVCSQFQLKLQQGADASAIFVHYSNNGPGITDLDGEQLAAISEAWVLLTTQYYSYQPKFFPLMNPFIPIECPFV